MKQWLFFLLTVPTVCLGQEPARMLTPQQMQQDVTILKNALISLHPGVYRYNSPTDIDAIFAQVAPRVRKPLPERTFYLLLSQLTAKLKCGHTYPNPYNLNPAVRNRILSTAYFPFYFTILSDRLIITHNLSDDPTIKPGDEITTINGFSARQITDSLLTVSRSDGNHSQGKKIDNLNLTPAAANGYAVFDMYFPLFFPATGTTYKVAIKPYGKTAKEKQITVSALAKPDRQARFEKRYGTLPRQEQTWQYRLLDSQTAYLQIGDLAVWGWKFDASRYLDSVFTSLNQPAIRQLIVDIRGCEGGDDDTRDKLLTYLVASPFGCENPTRRLYRSLSVPDSLMPYVQTWNEEFKKPKAASEYLKTHDGYYEKRVTSPCAPKLPSDKRFKGAIYLLTNATNSSTTFTLAQVFQTYQAGTIVGEPTGGSKQGLNGGQFFFLHLPNSGVEIDIPLIYQAPTTAQPDEGVQPDYVVPVNQQAIAAGSDAQLEFVKQLIKKQ